MSVARGREYMLTLSYPDKPGIVYAVPGFPVQPSADILASRQYGECPDGRFFMRVRFSVPAQDAGLARDLQLSRLERGFSRAARGVSHVLAAARQGGAGPHPDHGLPARLPGI